MWCQKTSCPSFGRSCSFRRLKRLSQSSRFSTWQQAQRAPPARMADEPPLTVDEWIEIHKLSPVVLRMVLRAGPLLTAVAIGATGSDPHLLALQDQPPEKDDTDAKSKPPDTVLVPKQPDFPPPRLHVIGAPAMGRPAAPLAAMSAWEAPLQAIGARSAGSSSSAGRKQPRLQMMPKSKHRKQLAKPRLSSPERGLLTK